MGAKSRLLVEEARRTAIAKVTGKASEATEMDCPNCGMLSVHPEEVCPVRGRGDDINHVGRPYDAAKDPTAEGD